MGSIIRAVRVYALLPMILIALNVTLRCTSRKQLRSRRCGKPHFLPKSTGSTAVCTAHRDTTVIDAGNPCIPCVDTVCHANSVLPKYFCTMNLFLPIARKSRKESEFRSQQLERASFEYLRGPSVTKTSVLQ